VLAVLLTMACFFVPALVVLERMSLVRALRESPDLLRQRFWLVLGGIVVLQGLPGFLMSLFAVPPIGAIVGVFLAPLLLPAAVFRSVPVVKMAPGARQPLA